MSHVHTLSHFAAEAFESLTHADSRVWKTLGYLLARPGLLTREFLDGRRARYLPPFRLYIVISLVFFLAMVGVGVFEILFASTAHDQPCLCSSRHGSSPT